jgi:hypothetical protein
MPGLDYLGQSSVRAAVLPARAAYLINEGSVPGLRRAVQEACSRWAGMTEPIVPVRPDGGVDAWWVQVAQLSKADQAVNVDVANPRAAATAAQQLDLQLLPLMGIDSRASITQFTCHPGAVGPPSIDQNAYVISSSEEAPLWEVIAAGDLTRAHLDGLSTETLWVRRAQEDDIARAQLWGNTLVARTVTQFGEHSAGGGPGAFSAIVWVTEPDSVQDCLFFWNLRALRPLRLGTVPMLLLPVDHVQHWVGFSAQLAHVLARPDEFAPDVVIDSLSLRKAKLNSTARLLGLRRTTKEIRSGHRWPTNLRQPPFTYRNDVDPRIWFTFERDYGLTTDIDVHLFKDVTNISMASPVTFTGAGSTLVRFSGLPFAPLPKHPAIASCMINGAVWSRGAVQVHTFAINNYRFEFHIPSLPESVDVVLREVTERFELSDKGRLGMALYDAADVTALLEVGAFEAITELTTPRSRTLLHELRRHQNEGEPDEALVNLAAEWGGRAERRYRSVDQLDHVTRSVAPLALERLCGQGWAERGLKIACTRCGVSSFVPLAAAQDRAECPGCHSSARYVTGNSLAVQYRLNSYLDRASDQGVLPHLLVAAALTQQSPQSYFLLGTNLWFADGATAEVDIFGIQNGKIVAGEVKTKASDFTTEQIRRDIELSARLRADVHVLAAVDNIPADVTENAKEHCDSQGLELVIFQRTDLRPSAD